MTKLANPATLDFLQALNDSETHEDRFAFQEISHLRHTFDVGVLDMAARELVRGSSGIRDEVDGCLVSD